MDIDDERFNKLKQFSAHDAEILKSLLEIGRVKEITVHHVDFGNGDLIISIASMDKNFDGVLDSIMFCALNKRMRINSVDFDTGEIKIQWLPYMPFGLTKEEIDLVKQRKTILALKAIRTRTGMDLKEAKKLLEKHWDTLQQKVFG